MSAPFGARLHSARFTSVVKILRQPIAQTNPVTPARSMAAAEQTRPTAPTDVFIGGAKLTELALNGSITDPRQQISGMAWHGDQLVLMPQWAKSLFVLSKNDVTSAVDGRTEPLTPREVSVGPAGFESHFPDFEGFEAIAFVGSRAYLLAEAKRGDDMFGYLVAGDFGPDGLTLDLSSVQTLPPATRIKNMGYEALLVANERLVVMPEANGGPRVAHTFDLSLKPLGAMPLPDVPFRLTDSTPADEDGRFWVANYNHPGDEGMPEAPRTEALLPMRLTATHVTNDGAPRPIAPNLREDSRNWEALARLDDKGFLVMTDEFPRAVFGFVPRED